MRKGHQLAVGSHRPHGFLLEHHLFGGGVQIIENTAGGDEEAAVDAAFGGLGFFIELGDAAVGGNSHFAKTARGTHGGDGEFFAVPAMKSP